MMRVLLWFALVAPASELPNPSHILVIQERDARERAMVRRIEMQLSRQPKPEKKSEVKPAEATEVPGLREAIERFVKEGRDVPDLRK